MGHICGRVYVEVCVTCVYVHVGIDPGVSECLCVFHRPCTTCSSCPPKPPSPQSSQSPQHVNAPPPRCMRLAALSISVCLTKRKLSCLGGPCTWPPQPLLTVLCYSHGAFLSRPFHYMLFPQEPQARGSERGPRRGSAPRTPPCRARVGVAVMASVDIL